MNGIIVIIIVTVVIMNENIDKHQTPYQKVEKSNTLIIYHNYFKKNNQNDTIIQTIRRGTCEKR